MPALHDSRILFLVTNMQVMSSFFCTISFRDNFCLLTISILSICFPCPLLHLDNIVIDELVDSLCRGGSVPLRDSQGERNPWFWIRFKCWAVDQQTSDQKSLPLLLYFGKRNPWVRWSFKGVAPTLLSMTCKSITSHFTGQQKQGSPSWGEKRDEIITFTFTLWGNNNRIFQGSGKYGMSWSLSLLLEKQKQGASLSCGEIWDELITVTFT